MIPRVLRNFSAFVNGAGYQGRVTEVKPPEIEVKTEDFRAAGMDGVAEIDMGLNTMSAKMTFAEYIPAILGAAGKLDGNATRVQLRGALQRDGEAAVPCVIDLHGGVKKSSLGTWKAGDFANSEVEMSIRYYKLTIGSDTIYEIDVDNMIRKIGGTDELASIRAAMGL